MNFMDYFKVIFYQVYRASIMNPSCFSDIIGEKLVSKAILNCDIDSLKNVVEGKPNEVFSTLIFDSYDDKRIEELLFLEGVRFIEETKEEVYRPSIKLPNHALNSLESSYGSHYYHSSSSQRYELDALPQTMLRRVQQQYSYQFQEDNSQRLHITCSRIPAEIYLKIQKTEKETCEQRILALSEDELKRIEFSIYAYSQQGNHLALSMTYEDINFQRFYVSKWLNANKPSNQTFNIPKCDSIPIEVKITFASKVWNVKTNISCHASSRCKFDARKFLLKRLCERHALNESMVSQMKKSFEIERFYHRISELSSEDGRLTREVNAKKERLNSIIEDIAEKKRQLNSLDLKLVGVHNELDAAIAHFKQFLIANELEHERSFEQLSLEEKHLLECKHMHEFYVQNARELEIYKFAFDNMRELSQKLEQEREAFEKERMTCKRESECSMRKREQELESKQAQFDKDCEAYELESTKWKAQQESKFAKYQKQINEYESLKAKVSTQQSEIQRLKNELSKVTKERDRLKITIETITEYRK